jgi:hypothetical protein
VSDAGAFTALERRSSPLLGILDEALRGTPSSRQTTAALPESTPS